MFKKFVVMAVFTLIPSLLMGCENDGISVNIEDNSKLSGIVFGEKAMVEIGYHLYYDSTTGIVYWWNGYSSDNCATMPTAYYAPNGLPYRYNFETNTFEEIKKEE